jgi:hypothetical protein
VSANRFVDILAGMSVVLKDPACPLNCVTINFAWNFIKTYRYLLANNTNEEEVKM